jgi:hypothetical protein
MIEVGCILQIYYADDSSWDDDNRSWCRGNIKGLYADVRVYGKVNTTLYRVPVMQRVHGMHDEDVYLPRPAAHDIGGGSLTILPSDSGQPTPAHRMDADPCIVAFLGNQPTRPVVLPFGPAHSASKRTLNSSDGRVRRIRINGTMIEWGSGGNLTIDATEAAKADLDAGGGEVSNSGTGGQITIKTTDALGGESSVVLDTTGGVTIADGGGNKLELKKIGNAKLQTTTLATIDAPQIMLATAALQATAATLVQHTGTKGWLSYWTSFNSTVQTLRDTFDPSVQNPPTPGSKADAALFQFFTALYTLGQGFLTAQTTITKAA